MVLDGGLDAAMLLCGTPGMALDGAIVTDLRLWACARGF